MPKTKNGQIHRYDVMDRCMLSAMMSDAAEKLGIPLCCGPMCETLGRYHESENAVHAFIHMKRTEQELT